MAADHPLPDAHLQHICKDLLEHILWEELARAADGGVPWQLVVQIVTDEEQDVQPHAAVLHQLPVTDDILQIADQAKFEEHNGIDALLSGSAIERLGQFVQILQIQHTVELSVEVVLWHTFTQ